MNIKFKIKKNGKYFYAVSKNICIKTDSLFDLLSKVEAILPLTTNRFTLIIKKKKMCTITSS